MQNTVYYSYTLFQLYEIMKENDIDAINCPLNKDSMIKTIFDRQLDIPIYLEDMMGSYWFPSKVGINEYALYLGTDLYLCEGDMVTVNQVFYEIVGFYYDDDETYYDSNRNKKDFKVILKDTDTEVNNIIGVEEFVKMMDADNRTTINYSLYLDC